MQDYFQSFKKVLLFTAITTVIQIRVWWFRNIWCSILLSLICFEIHQIYLRDKQKQTSWCLFIDFFFFLLIDSSELFSIFKISWKTKWSQLSRKMLVINHLILDDNYNLWWDFLQRRLKLVNNFTIVCIFFFISICLWHVNKRISIFTRVITES